MIGLFGKNGGKRKDQIYRTIDGEIQHKNECLIHNGVDKKKQQLRERFECESKSFT